MKKAYTWEKRDENGRLVCDVAYWITPSGYIHAERWSERDGRTRISASVALLPWRYQCLDTLDLYADAGSNAHMLWAQISDAARTARLAKISAQQHKRARA